jgi:hypothetical protein
MWDILFLIGIAVLAVIVLIVLSVGILFLTMHILSGGR